MKKRLAILLLLVANTACLNLRAPENITIGGRDRDRDRNERRDRDRDRDDDRYDRDDDDRYKRGDEDYDDD